MWVVLIPIVVIGGIFVVFYMFKDKFQGKTIAAYNEAVEKWQKKDEVLNDFFSSENKFKMVQDAVGDAKIECLIYAKPKKGSVGKFLKKGAELLVGVETFDMSAHYLAIAGDELCYVHSDGSKVVENMAFDLNNLTNTSLAPESGAAAAAKFLTGANSDGKKALLLKFTSNDVDYTFNVSEMIETFAKFTVEKMFVGNSKFGDNPFYRVPAEGVTDTDNQLLYMFGAESLQRFKDKFAR